MSKINLLKLFLFVAGLLFLTLSPRMASLVDAQATIPTRTPTPAVVPTSVSTPAPTATQSPPQATPPPQATDPPRPTNTVTAQATAAAASATASPWPPTPAGGLFPTAVLCSLEPTVQAFAGAVIVRSGPGQDYDSVGQIAYLDVRPIIGRSASSPWWQVALDEDSIGWVADEFVVVSGYTGAIPVLPSPALPTGDTPTPGAAWEPTPNPVCTPPPTATATDVPASATPVATEMLPATSTQVVPTAKATRSEESEAQGSYSQSEATTTAVSPPTKIPESAKQPAATAAPLGTDLAAGSTNSLDIWLPIMGVGLVLAGVILLFVRRR